MMDSLGAKLETAGCRPGRTVGVVSHGEDLDGVASALLTHQYLRMRYSGDTVLPPAFADYAGMERVIAHVAESVDEIWITDLSFKDPSFFSRVLGKFPKDRVVIVDHHASSRPCLEAWQDRALVVFDDSGESCAADLVWKHVRDSVSAGLSVTRQGRALYNALDHLAQCAHDRDLWRRQMPDADGLSDVVTVMGPERTVEELIASPLRVYGRKFTPAMQLCLEVARKDVEQSLAVARATQIRCHFSAPPCYWTLITAQSLGAQSDVAEVLMAENNRDRWPVVVAMYNIARNALEFRMNNRAAALGFGVNTIAAEFGGGGHPCAAGAPMIPGVIEGGPVALADHVVRVLVKKSYIGESARDTWWARREHISQEWRGAAELSSQGLCPLGSV